MEQLPVTIITGFLGAGKTTFLNHLIASQADTRFAIIENEFGEIGIDQELVLSAGDGIFELSNGCICCTMSGELIETINKLLQRRGDFDHLLIETTGIAEPGEIAAAFVAHPEVSQHFRIDGIVCLVDALQVEDTLTDRDEARKQLTFANLILVNKTDQVPPEAIENRIQLLNSINPFAEICTALKGDPGAAQTQRLLQLNAFQPAHLENQLSVQSQHPVPHSHSHSHSHAHDITTYSIVVDEPLDPLKFGHWANVLLKAQGERFYRIKGIVQYPFRDSRVVFQSVGKMHAFSQGSDWGPEEQRSSKLVFIGKDLRRDILEKAVRNCIWHNPFAD